MADKHRSRFSVSGDTGDMDFKIQPLNINIKKDMEALDAAAGESKPVSSILTHIPKDLAVDKFVSAVVTNNILPILPAENHLNQVVDTLRQAAHASREGGNVELTHAQVAQALGLVCGLLEGVQTANIALTTLEWTNALHSLCLRHLLDNPTKTEALRTERMRARMMKALDNHLNSDDAEETHV